MVERAGSLAQTLTPTAVSGNQFNADNAMTGFGTQTLSYDANENISADANNIYTWDARNHLTGITGILPSTASASFQYDALGRRVLKTINGTNTAFLYDNWNPVQELTPAALGQYVVIANNLTGLGIDEYFQRTDSVNGSQTFLSDFLNSTIVLTNSSGSVTTSYGYEPFGNVSISNASLTDPNPYQFTGRENDGLGLYFYRARYYSPTDQRFSAQDPEGFSGGDVNLYGHVLNRPMSFADPFGLCDGMLCLPTPTATPTRGPEDALNNPDAGLKPLVGSPDEPGFQCENPEPPPPPPPVCPSGATPPEQLDPIGIGTGLGAIGGTSVGGFPIGTTVGGVIGFGAGVATWFQMQKNCP